ncbi:MAG: hypothetical protein QOF53_4186 [Nocardioidaceae bacterium]|nr:hypothetical protein [Nocardioidaceae bacterium]
MGWFIGAVVVVAFVTGVMWFFAPTLRLIGRPDFEPTPKDDASVFNAQQTGMVDGGQ